MTRKTLSWDLTPLISHQQTLATMGIIKNVPNVTEVCHVLEKGRFFGAGRSEVMSDT
jgi:hypothetical protein